MNNNNNSSNITVFEVVKIANTYSVVATHSFTFLKDAIDKMHAINRSQTPNQATIHWN